MFIDVSTERRRTGSQARKLRSLLRALLLVLLLYSAPYVGEEGGNGMRGGNGGKGRRGEIEWRKKCLELT